MECITQKLYFIGQKKKKKPQLFEPNEKVLLHYFHGTPKYFILNVI